MNSPQQNSGHWGPISFLDDTTGHMSQLTGQDSAHSEGLHGERTRGSWLQVSSGPHPMCLFPSLTSFAFFGVIHFTHEHNYIYWVLGVLSVNHWDWAWSCGSWTREVGEVVGAEGSKYCRKRERCVDKIATWALISFLFWHLCLDTRTERHCKGWWPRCSWCYLRMVGF